MLLSELLKSNLINTKFGFYALKGYKKILDVYEDTSDNGRVIYRCPICDKTEIWVIFTNNDIKNCMNNSVNISNLTICPYCDATISGKNYHHPNISNEEIIRRYNQLLEQSYVEEALPELV